MKEELDEALCKKYPKIFKNRYADMRTTCMCWGFSHGDGWYRLIDQLCAYVQGRINQSRKSRLMALRANRKAASIIKHGTIRNYAKAFYAHVKDEVRREEFIKEMVSHPEDLFWKNIPDAIPQVVANQVKEKFGSLRFYYQGGNEEISAVVSYTEWLAGRTCEQCGEPGRWREGSWIRTLCDKHAKEMGYKDES
jgi:hypothetical protein